MDRAVTEVERRHGRLDVLVNNAGVALDWCSASELSVDVFEKTFETNVFGAFRVTRAMLPLLKKSRHGRIVNISSGLPLNGELNGRNGAVPAAVLVVLDAVDHAYAIEEHPERRFLGPGSSVGPTRIPMGSTEVASPGVSPFISATSPMAPATSVGATCGASSRCSNPSNLLAA